jgi:hypothetical protein
MNRKSTKFFTLFWLLAGIIWIIAATRHITLQDEITSSVIYVIAAIISFILASAFHRGLR